MNRSRIFSAVMVVGVAAFVTVLATRPALKRNKQGRVFRTYTGSADYSSDKLADELKKLANE